MSGVTAAFLFLATAANFDAAAAKVLMDGIKARSEASLLDPSVPLTSDIKNWRSVGSHIRGLNLAISSSMLDRKSDVLTTFLRRADVIPAFANSGERVALSKLYLNDDMQLFLSEGRKKSNAYKYLRGGPVGVAELDADRDVVRCSFYLVLKDETQRDLMTLDYLTKDGEIVEVRAVKMPVKSLADLEQQDG